MTRRLSSCFCELLERDLVQFIYPVAATQNTSMAVLSGSRALLDAGATSRHSLGMTPAQEAMYRLDILLDAIRNGLEALPDTAPADVRAFAGRFSSLRDAYRNARGDLVGATNAARGYPEIP